MMHALSIWFVIVGFLGAGFFNAIGTSGTQSDFARWGYPPWWSYLTGGLEIMSAVLIALPASRIIGLTLAATIIAAAVLTVLRHRDVLHLLPLGLFAALIALAAISP
jgi:DoxX-like protein